MRPKGGVVINNTVYQEIRNLSSQYNDRVNRVINALHKSDFDEAMNDIAMMLFLAQSLLKLAVKVRDESSVSLLENVLSSTVTLATVTAKAELGGELNFELLANEFRAGTLQN